MSQSPRDTLQTRRDATTEDIALRNYDLERSHRVWVTVVGDGDRLLETTRRLRPGEERGIDSSIAPGEYDVEVGIDGLRRTVENCQIGGDAERTVLVEMGNGLVSVSQEPR